LFTRAQFFVMLKHTS